MKITGFIFDLDGTLVDSKLDFDKMRQEMDLGPQVSILEAIENMAPHDADRCRNILHKHEYEGANNASVMPGVHQFLDQLDRLKIRRAIVTRNSRKTAIQMLNQCALGFEIIVAREDGPAKPDPWPIKHICRLWNVESKHVVMVGDFRFDIEAGRSAGAKTVFFSKGKHIDDPALTANADLALRSFEQAHHLLEALQLELPTQSH